MTLIDIPRGNTRICSFVSSARTISATSTPRVIAKVQAQEVVTSSLKHDSHADMIVLGQNAVILNYTGRECAVSPYTDEYDTIKGVLIMK